MRKHKPPWEARLTLGQQACLWQQEGLGVAVGLASRGPGFQPEAGWPGPGEEWARQQGKEALPPACWRRRWTGHSWEVSGVERASVLPALGD